MHEAENKRYTVLVVDDDLDLLQLLTDGLELLGNFTVVSATDGVQGLERFFEIRPDCMIIDIKMPGLDGYQLIRACVVTLNQPPPRSLSCLRWLRNKISLRAWPWALMTIWSSWLTSTMW